jgi:hypothetical protein
MSKWEEALEDTYFYIWRNRGREKEELVDGHSDPWDDFWVPSTLALEMSPHTCAFCSVSRLHVGPGNFFVEFIFHARQLAEAMERYSDLTGKLGLRCCWGSVLCEDVDEVQGGEGSIILGTWMLCPKGRGQGKGSHGSATSSMCSPCCGSAACLFSYTSF